MVVKRNLKTLSVVIILLLAIFAGFVILMRWVFSNEPGPNYPPNISYFQENGHSKIDPQTILESLDRSETDMFQLESGIPEDPTFVSPVEWTQTEFLEVSSALQQFVWKESMDDWNLYRINFITPCKDDHSGFGKAEFYYYKDTIVDDNHWYSIRVVQINPQYGYVAWGSDPKSRPPMIGDWEYINKNTLTVSADAALEKAEADGGATYRKSIANDCLIYVFMNPETSDRIDWNVSYSGGDDYWIPPN